MYDSSEQFTAAFAAIYLIVFGALYTLLIAWSVVSYIFTSRSLHTIAKRRGIDKPWLAWVPVGNAWILGCISDQYRYVARGQVKNKRKKLVVSEIFALAALVLFLIFYIAIIVNVITAANHDDVSFSAVAPVFGSFISLFLVFYGFMAATIVYSVFYYMALYDLFNSCDPKRCLVYFLVGIFTSYPLPFFLHMCRNKDLGMPPRQEAAQPEITEE